MYAHAFKAPAADRRRGVRYLVTLTVNGDLSIARERRGTVEAADLRAARKVAQAYGAKPHNF
jgi:hypothetical protein